MTVTTIVLALIAVVCSLSANYWYKSALRIREAGAREALAHFLLQKEVAELANTQLYGDRIGTTEHTTREYIEGYSAGFFNAQQEVVRIIEDGANRYMKADDSVAGYKKAGGR